MKTLSFKVTEKMEAIINWYADKMQINKSAAIKSLISKGAAAENYRDDL